MQTTPPPHANTPAVDGQVRRRALLRGAAIGAGSVVLLARHGRAAADKPEYGGKLRVAYNLAPGSLDPTLAVSGGDTFYWKQAYDVLIDNDQRLTPRPDRSLAESWDLSDSRAVTLKLRKGVTFHDGTAFNAGAVKATIDRILDPATRSAARAEISPVERVEAVEEHLVRLHLSRPWGPATTMLGGRAGAINSPSAVKALGVDYRFRPSGTGPFKVAEFVSGSMVRLVRNEHYWGRDEAGNPLPYLDEIVLNIVPDQTVQTNALKAGEMDLVFLPYRDAPQFQDKPGYNVNVFENAGTVYVLLYNRSKPPLDNINLRLAIAHAVNPAAINKAAYFGRASVATGGMWPPSTWAYDGTVPRPSYNPAKAREYLALGDKPNGFEVDAVSYPSEANTPSAEIVRAQLAAVGIKMNLRMYDVTTASEKFYYGGAAPLYLSGWGHVPEPSSSNMLYRSNGYYNASKLPDARLDALLDAGDSTVDIAQRKAIYRKVDEIVLGEAMATPLIYGTAYAAAPKRVRGLESVFTYDIRMYLHRLWLEKT